MGSKTATNPTDGLAVRESCRRMVEDWLTRDLRRLMLLSSMDGSARVRRNDNKKEKETHF